MHLELSERRDVRAAAGVDVDGFDVDQPQSALRRAHRASGEPYKHCLDCRDTQAPGPARVAVELTLSLRWRDRGIHINTSPSDLKRQEEVMCCKLDAPHEVTQPS